MKYRICTLVVESSHEFKLIPRERDEIDVDIKLNFINQKLDNNIESDKVNLDKSNLHSTYLLENNYTIELRQPDLTFNISLDLTSVECIYPHEVSIERAQLDFLGIIISFILAKKRIYALHASAVNYRSKTIGFIGKSGAGKSTLSQYLCSKKDFFFFSDDMFPIKYVDRKNHSIPTYPLMKIKKDEIRKPISKGSEPVPDDNEKEQVYVGDFFSYSNSVKNVSAIIVLERIKDHPDRKKIEFLKINDGNAFKELITNIFGITIYSEDMIKDLMKNLKKIITTIPIYILRYPSGKEYLHEVYEKLKNLIDEVEL